jgi:hypothetical protein
MLRTEYCLARAERLRMLMLTASDPAAADRLRGFVRKYRILAERAKREEERPPSSTPQLAVSNSERLNARINRPPQLAASPTVSPPSHGNGFASIGLGRHGASPGPVGLTATHSDTYTTGYHRLWFCPGVGG